MITCITYDNLTVTGAAFAAQFELRHRGFIERQGYDVKSYRGREYDAYDTPASVYLVYEGEGRQALGVSRLTPLSQGCMIEDLWPDMIDGARLDRSGRFWEGTRFCVDRSLAPAQRRRIAQELVLGYLEFGLAMGIEAIVGVMHGIIMRRVFRDAGVSYAVLGSKIVDGQRLDAAQMAVGGEKLSVVRRTTGIMTDVLTPDPKKAWFTPAAAA